MQIRLLIYISSFLLGLCSCLNLRNNNNPKYLLASIQNRNTSISPRGIHDPLIKNYAAFLYSDPKPSNEKENEVSIKYDDYLDNIKYTIAGTVLLSSTFLTIGAIKDYNKSQLYSPDAPKVADIIGHALIEKTRHPSLFQRGILAPLTNYVSTLNAIPKNSLVALYFHSGSVENILKSHGYPLLNPKLKALKDMANASGKPIKFVYVSLDRWQNTSYDHFMQMDWLAIPFDERSRIENLCHRFEVNTLPSIVLLDSSGRVINDRALYVLLTNPNGYPWKVDSVVDLMGDKLIDQNQDSVSVSSLKGSVIGLYFGSAGKSPYGFNDKLINFYNAVKKKTGGNFELVYVSNDQNLSQFNDQMKSLSVPMLAIPYNNVQTRLLLQNYLEIHTTPSLVLINSDGKIITKDGRFYMETDPNAENLLLDSNEIVCDLANNIDGFAHFPVLITFADNASTSEKNEILSQVEKAANEHYINRRGKKLKFCVSLEPHPRADAIKRLCGFKPTNEKGNNLKLVILDLMHQKVFIEEDVKLKDLGNKINIMIENYYNSTLPSKPIILK